MNLADEIEGAEGPSRELDAKIVAVVQAGMRHPWFINPPPFTKSIDAAMTLVDVQQVEATLCTAMLRCGQFLGNVTAADLPRFICSTALRGEG